MKAKTTMGTSRPADGLQRGASLIMVMIILTIVSLLGIAGIQISMMSERGARNDRDMQLAWQSAEAALMDAENDLFGPGTSSRRIVFTPVTDSSLFIDGCGSTGNSIGLCRLVTTGKPSWLTVDFTDATSSATTTAYGKYTARSFAAGGAGVQPAKVPRYIIEAIKDPGDTNGLMIAPGQSKYVYRVTAMGFGPRSDIQAIVQMVYRD